MNSANKNTFESFILFKKRFNLGKSITVSSVSSIIIVLLLFFSEIIYEKFRPITTVFYFGLILLNIFRYYHNKNLKLDAATWIKRFVFIQILIILFFSIIISLNFYFNKSPELKIILYIFINSIASALSLWMFLEFRTLLICCGLLILTASYGFYQSTENIFLALFSILAVVTYFGNLIRQSYIKYNVWVQERSDEYKLRQLENVYKRKKFSELGQLISEIMHDLNNPLSNIYMKIQILERQLLKYNLDEEFLQTISSLKNSSMRISKMTHSINEIVGKSQESINQAMSVFDLFEGLTEKFQEQCDIFQIEFNRNKSEALKYVSATDHVIYSFDLILSLVDSSIQNIKDNANKWVTLEIEKNDHFIILKIADSENEFLKNKSEKNWTQFRNKRSEVIHKFIENTLVENGGSFLYQEYDIHFQYIIQISLNSNSSESI